MAKQGLQSKIQRFGSHLSGMVMPNIGAFIAWGIITALFIEDGYLPNEGMAGLVDPMITYLLPLLIGFTGGRMVYDIRGGVVGATATMGMIVGADIPDRKSTRLNSSHVAISYAVFCLKQKN